jgi:thiamine-monophosphate kinase
VPETLADIGEFGLIDRIDEILRHEGVKAPGVTLGLGDDTASFRPRQGYELLITCDVLVEDRHYLPRHISPLELGRRAMAVNISDIGAMGGQPLYALVSLGLRGDTPVADIEDMYRGFLAELNPLEASVIGGNITKTGGSPFIDITLVGEVEAENIMRRSTAQSGNSVLVTGYPGQSAAGLQLLLDSQASEELRNHPLVRAYNTPIPRVREGQAVARSGYGAAMIDTSDGFLGDLGHICEESGVGAVLIQEKLPISADLRETAKQLGRDPYQLFLQDSDDYELIITCSPEHVGLIQSSIASVSDVLVTEVGTITDTPGEVQLLLLDGSRRTLSTKGWDHFAT